MAARRAVQAKTLASNSNLSVSSAHNKSRLKATSMTNLVTSETASGGGRVAHNNSPTNRPIHRPASRNALDSIHKGMNAKFTHVQSKVLLQNIRPQAGQSKTQTNTSSTPSSRIPSTTPTSTLRHKSHFASNSALGPSGGGGRPTATAISRAVTQAVSGANKIQQSDRSQLINKIKALQEQIELQEAARDELRQELEREKADKSEQVQQVKLELQEKVAEYERHNEEYHQKLLEAYELADQNRRAADSVLSESRQREEELRKKIDELEQQLGELKEFVAMKEEMVGKMGELREQIRVERERYEDKTGQLGQMFENEKIRLEKELMEKVKQVGESYELTKLKTQNRTIELDARLSSERLLATKMRLSQVSNENERLNKQLRSHQQQLREQEKKLLLAETMLRQFVSHDNRHSLESAAAAPIATLPVQTSPSLGAPRSIKRQQHSGLAAKSRMFRQARLVKFGGGGSGGALVSIKAAAPPPPPSASSITRARMATVASSSVNKAQSGSNAAPIETLFSASELETVPATTTTTTLALLGQERQQFSDTGDRAPQGQADASGGGKKVSSSGAAAEAVARLTSAAKGGNSGQVAAMSLLRSTTSPHLASLSRAAGATGGGSTTATATTQTRQPSRARTIINDLRQRLNLGHSKATPPTVSVSAPATTSLATEVDRRASGKDSASGGGGGPTVEKIDAAIQASLLEFQGPEEKLNLDSGSKSHDFDDHDNYEREAAEDRYEDEALLYVGQGQSDYEDVAGGGKDEQSRQRRRLQSSSRQRSISLDAFLSSSIVREVGGERLIISRGWPPTMIHRHKQQRQQAQQMRHSSRRKHEHHQHEHRRRYSRSHHSHRSGGGAPSSEVTFLQQRRPSLLVRSPRTNGPPIISMPATQQSTISETQKRRLLIEYLEQVGVKGTEPIADGGRGGALSSSRALSSLKETSSGNK